jgi:hypothetical protein
VTSVIAFLAAVEGPYAFSFPFNKIIPAALYLSFSVAKIAGAKLTPANTAVVFLSH